MNDNQSPIQDKKVTLNFKDGKLHCVQTADIVLETKVDYLKSCYAMYCDKFIDKEEFDKVASEICKSDLPDGDNFVPSIFVCSGNHFHVSTFNGEHDGIFSYKEFDNFCAWAIENNIITKDDVARLEVVVGEHYPNFPTETPKHMQMKSNIINSMFEKIFGIQVVEIPRGGQRI